MKKKVINKLILIIIFFSIIIIINILIVGFIKNNKELKINIKKIEKIYSKKISIKTKNNNIIIKSKNIDLKKGLILYSEKNINPNLYIGLGRIIAEKGYCVIISKFLFNNYNLNVNKIKNIIDSNKDINNWVLGGHGEGGIFASKMLNVHKKINGIFFLASYPEKSINFDNKKLKIYSIIGDSDNILSIKQWKEKNKKLPRNTVFTIIEKGNHNYYADCKEENIIIKKDEQQLQTSVQLINLLDEIK